MGLTFIVVGSLLIAVNVYGRMRNAVPGSVPTGRAPVAGYDFRKLPPRVAKARFRQLKQCQSSKLEKLDSLFHLISGSVVHRKYRIDMFDNWLLRTAALVYPEVRNTQDAGLLWTRGAGKCDQASLLLLSKAGELGIEGRILGLDGHVLVETKCDLETQVIDADMGCFWNCSYEQLRATDRADLASAYERRGYSSEQAEHNARIIRESTEWRRIEFPPAMLRHRFERMTAWLAWLLPCAAVLYGAAN